MKTYREYLIKVGFNRCPKRIFNEIEAVSSKMLRNGWILSDSCCEDGLAYIHLFFERNIDKDAIVSEATTVERNIHEI